jgi:hypothetical protein
VPRKKLKPSTTEVVKGVLIHVVKDRSQACERYFPSLADSGGIVTYELIDTLTTDQAEYIAYEMASLVGGFAFEERKIRNGYTGPGRPGLLEEPPSESDKEEQTSSVRIKRRLMERALADLCDAYDLESPLS